MCFTNAKKHVLYYVPYFHFGEPQGYNITIFSSCIQAL